MTRRLAPLLVLAGMLIPASAAAADLDASVFAGAGARFCAGDTSTIGSLRGVFEVAPLLSVAVGVDGYLDAPRPDSHIAFAGWQAGLQVELPVPGLLTPELGLAYGRVNLLEDRHGVDATVALVHAEIALRGDLGPVKARLAWAQPVWSADAGTSERGLQSQLTFSLGVGL